MTPPFPPRRRLLGQLAALGSAPLWPTPAAHAQTPLPLSAFTAPPRVTHLCLSPDGQRLAWLLHLDGVTALVSRRIDEAQPVQVLRQRPGIAIAWVGWVSDERLLVGTHMVMRRSGIDRIETRLLAVRHDGQELRLLTPPPSQGGSDAQIQDRVIDWLPDEANQVLVERPPDSRRLEPSVCRLDTTTGRFTVVHPAERQVLHWMTDPQHRVRIGWRIADGRQDILGCDPDGTRWRTLWSHEVLDADAVRPIGLGRAQRCGPRHCASSPVTSTPPCPARLARADATRRPGHREHRRFRPLERIPRQPGPCRAGGQFPWFQRPGQRVPAGGPAPAGAGRCRTT